MPTRQSQITLLVADDDPDDRLLTADALRVGKTVRDIRFVSDGVELLEYLRHQGKYARGGDSPRPGLVLLDLNMPRMDGREALRAIKSDPALLDIPVVVLTTSNADDDIDRSYQLGGSSYIRKPPTFDGLVNAMQALERYWLEVVELPPQHRSPP